MFGVLLLFSTPVIALPAPDACPTLYVSQSSSEKGKATFSAMLSGGAGNVDPTFNWSVSAGTVTAGQGTVSISVEANPGENVTATVDVGGYAPECSSSSSATTEISAIDASACPAFGIDLIESANGAATLNATAVPQPTMPLEINWSVSSPATILSGQGSGSISVKAPAGQDFIAAYDLTGLPSACEARVSNRFTTK